MKQVLGLRVLIDPIFLGGLQQAVGADNIRVDEGIGALYRSVDMALRRKVNYRINLMFMKARLPQFLITNRAVNKLEPILT